MQERLPKTYCPIKNTIAEALGRQNLSAYESRILWIVIRKTYGWTTKDGTRKTEDWISLTQFSEATGMPKSHISRTIKLLILRRIITKRGKFLGINKHTEEWNNAGHKDLQGVNLPKEVKEITKPGKKRLPNQVTTKESKEIITKENNTHVEIVTNFEQIWIRYPNKDGKKEAERHFKSSVKTNQDWKDINIALDNYLKDDKVLRGYIKNGSTWFNNWRDWISGTITKPRITGVQAENLAGLSKLMEGDSNDQRSIPTGLPGPGGSVPRGKV